MNYREWLEKTLSEMVKEKNENINLKVYEFSDARFNGNDNDCVVVINGLGGSTDSDDVEVVPVQLTIFTGTMNSVNEDGDTAYDIVFDVLKEFCKKYNRQSMILNDFDYYKQNYNQPYPINPLENDNASFRMTFVISGSLTISRNISDINKIFINGQEIAFLKASLSYATNLTASKKISQFLTRNAVQTSSLSLQIETYNRNNILGNIMRSLRTEKMKPNQPLTCTLEFNDGIKEEYQFVISQNVITSDKINPSGSSYLLALF